MKRIYLIYLIAILGVADMAAQKPFVDFGPADRFFDLEGHLLVGASSVTQNYRSTFPEISELDQSTGWSLGLGAAGEFGLRDYMWLGTEINLLVCNTATDLVVSRQNAVSVSNVFLRNRYYYLNFPVYMSFKFNVADNIRWNVDGGLYYSYGVGGRQKQSIYNAKINEIGQLISTITNDKCGYFNDSRSFINSAWRSDIGLHVATGLTFNKLISVGVRGQIGFKNIAHTVGIDRPNLHNLSFLFQVGYHFR